MTRESRPGVAGRFRGLVDEHDTHRYTENVSPECRRWFVEDSNAHPKSRGT